MSTTPELLSHHVVGHGPVLARAGTHVLGGYGGLEAKSCTRQRGPGAPAFVGPIARKPRGTGLSAAPRRGCRWWTNARDPARELAPWRRT